jgi:hypothetical protein
MYCSRHAYLGLGKTPELVELVPGASSAGVVYFIPKCLASAGQKVAHEKTELNNIGIIRGTGASTRDRLEC